MAGADNIKKYEFKKGQSGNPKGRPVGSKNRSSIVKKWLETVEKAKNPISGELEDLSQEDMITLAILKKARTGDVRAYKELMDSLYGTAKDTIDINASTSGIDFDELMEAMRKNAKP